MFGLCGVLAAWVVTRVPAAFWEKHSLALLLCDQRMPHMSGLEVLGQSMQIFPQAKRALLTAYADTNAAIAAINTAKVHYYLPPRVVPVARLAWVLAGVRSAIPAAVRLAPGLRGNKRSHPAELPRPRSARRFQNRRPVE